MISQLQGCVLTQQGVVALERFRLSQRDRLRVHLENADSVMAVVSIGKPDRAWHQIWRSTGPLALHSFPAVASLLRGMMDALIALTPRGYIDPTLCARALGIAMQGASPLPAENPLDLSNDTLALERGGTRIVWDNIFEGEDGDYNPNDVGDVNLLRFSVSRLDAKRWEAVDDSSYCTAVPATTSPGALIALLTQMMDYVGGETYIKRLCEELSWMDPDDAAKALERGCATHA